MFKPMLNDVEGDSWEELDPAEIANGAVSLRWLVWVWTELFSLNDNFSLSPSFMILYDHCGIYISMVH